MSTSEKKNLDWHEMLFALHTITKVISSSSWSKTPHRLNHYMLLVIVSGTGLLSINRKQYYMKQGDCFLLLPGTVREICKGDMESIEYYELSFQKLHISDSQKEDLNEEEDFPLQGKLTVSPFSQLLDSLKRLSIHKEDADAIELFKRNIHFQELLHFIFAQNWGMETQLDSILAVERTVQNLQHTFHEDISVKQLAQQAQLGLWQYRKIFKKLTGQSPNEYVTGLRMNRAKEMLLLSKDRLSVIANQVGYNDEYYFNRRFKQTVGLTPRQYVRTRKNHLNIIALTHLGDLLSLGVKPRAADRNLLEWMDKKYVADIEAVGMSPKDIDRAVALRPDIILANSYTDPQLLGCLEHIAPIVQFTSGIGMLQCLQDAADLLDKQAEARIWIDRYENKAEQVRKEAASYIQKGETALFIHVVNGKLYLYTPKEMPVLYDVLGFTPPQKLLNESCELKTRIFIPLSSLPEYEANRIFIVHGNMKGARETFYELLTSPIWKSLVAVQSNQVYFPDDHWTLDGSIALEWQLDGIVALLRNQISKKLVVYDY